MSRSWNTLRALSVGGAFALSSLAYAQPQTQVPLINTSQGTEPAGVFVADGTGGTYTVNSVADTFEAVLGQSRQIVGPNDALVINVEVLDALGTSVTGVAGVQHDYILTGSIDLDGDGTIDVSGTLLTAQVEEIVSYFGAPGFGGQIDLRFTPTGGQLFDLGFYEGRSLDVFQILEFGGVQSFPGNFATDFFAGDVKATTSTQSAYGTGTVDIGDKVFFDENGDGIQQPSEPGMAGVRVLLRDGNGDVVSIAFTDSNGLYTFRNLEDDNYTVQVDPNTIPADFSPTLANQGADDARDSDSVGGAPVDVNVQQANGDDFTIDFGYIADGNGSIGDTLFIDTDRDGIQDTGEPGIQGVTVTLTDSDGNVTTTVTGPNGFYTFPGLAADTYIVDVIESTLPPGLTPTQPNQGGNTTIDSNFPLDGGAVTVVLGDNNTDDPTIDGGYVTPATGTIGDFVWTDTNGNGIQDPDELDDGIDNVTVKLLQDGVVIATTTTGPNGSYEFTGLPSGDYVVMIVDGPGTPLANLTPSPDNQGGDNASDSNGVNGMATVTLDTDSDEDPTIDFGYVPAAEGQLGNYVFFDADRDGIQDPDENGISGVEVILLDENMMEIGRDTTDLNGAYLFTGLPAGVYKVQIDNGTLPTGYTPTITDVDNNNNDTLDSDGPQDGTAVMVELPTNGSENLTIDFGFVAPAEGRLGNFVFLDTDNDGIQDSGEPGLEGILVELRDSTGTVVQSQETNSDGQYLFEGLLAGTYTVDVNDADLPVGYAPTLTEAGGNTALDSNGPQDGGAVTVTLLTDTSEDLTIDFGYVAPAEGQLGNFVFNDFDQDGIQDTGEQGIEGVRVELRDPITMDLIAFTLTEADGSYDFSGLLAGDYKIVVIPPTGATMSPADQGVDDELDSDANGVIANLPTNQSVDNSYDFGFYFPELGRIGDFVWFDENANGVQDNGEEGIPGVTVELRDGTGTLLATDVTGAFGDYIFEMLPAGDYRVDVIEATLPAGYVLSPTDAGGNDDLDSDGPQDGGFVEVNLQFNNSEDLSIDFGYNRPTGSAIGDTIFNDIDGDGVQGPNEPGLEGATVTLINKDTGEVLDVQVTGPNGQYLFDNLPAGNYTIQVTPPAGFEGTVDPDGTIDNMTMLTLGVNDTNLDQDFGYNQPVGRLGDFVWLDTNANGIQDAGENGIANVTVNLLQGGQVVATQQTGAQGEYLFEGLTGGTYQVDVVEATLPAGVVETTQNAGNDDSVDSDVNANGAPVTVTLNGDNDEDLTIDFGYVGTGSIGDTIWNDTDGDGVLDAGEMGLPTVTVKLLDAAGNLIATTVTDNNGNYSFDNLPAGDYIVMVDPATLPAGLAQTFDLDGNLDDMTPVSLNPGETRNDVDFGYQPNGTIGDRVFDDLNGNGQQDAGEPGIAGVTVNLLNAAGNVIATDVTDANGNYLFEGLAAATYGVDFIDPAGFTPTVANVGDDATDSDNPLNSAPVVVVLGAAQVNLTIDAGYIRPAALGDKVFVDTNGNGVQDAGEPGVPGVTVELLDAAGNVLATQTTDNNGTYLFANLAPGTYRVRFVEPNGFDFTTANAGNNDAVDSDADTTTGLSPLVNLSSGETNLTVDAGIVDEGNPNVCNNPVDIDFNGLPTGTIVDDEYAAFGITVSTNNANRPAMIFDSSNPTGGDFDLGTPNSDFGGPGIGSGGRAGQPGQNNIGLGNVLIISEDGDQNDPDDNASGGTLIFTFDTPKDVLSVDLLDIDANENSVIRAYRANGTLISSTPMNGFGNNSVKTVVVNALDVSRLEIQISGSGAVTGLHLCMDNAVPTDKFCPEEANGDQFGGNAGGHAMVWFNVGSFLFQDAMWQEFSDGTARLTGKLTDANDPTRSFGVDVVASGRTMTAPAGSPKKELIASAYSENGGPIDVSTYKYYTGLTGTLMGMGEFAGASVTLDRRGPALQVGNGANGKNITFGASSWIDLTTTAQPTTGATLPTNGNGDFNLDFADCAMDPDCMIGSGDTVGSSNAGGSSSYNNGVWTVTSGGGNWGSADNVQFVHKKVTGDTEVIARLTSAEDLAQYGRAGLMIRESLAAGSKNVAASYLPRYDAMTLIKRWDTNGSTGNTGWKSYVNTPVWIKLTRVGDVFTHSYSTDGVNYIVVATKTLPMNAMLEVGLYAAGHGWGSNPSDYTFDNFTVDGVAVKDDCEPVEPNTASIGDTVWLDENANGILDGGEAGIAAVTVKLLNASGAQIATTTTDANGNYLFSDLAAGDYSVMIDASTVPADLLQTYELDGSLNGMTDVSLTAGQNVTDVDFGYYNAAGECGTCSGGVTTVTLKNIKPHALWVKIKQTDSQGNRVVTFDEQVQPGATFTLNGLKSDGTFGHAYWIIVDGVHVADPRTDCSDDTQLGDVIAGKFEVVGGASTDGGPFCPAPVDMSKGEVGSVTVWQDNAWQWHTVQLDRNYTNPVIILSMATANSQHPITLRTRNAGSSSFQFQVDEWNYQNGYHPTETINYMVIEAGEYTLANGKKLVAGSVNTPAGTSVETWVNFGTTFNSVPVVISQAGNANSDDASVTRQRSISTTGFKLRDQEEEAANQYRRGGTIYYVAVEKGVSGGNMPFEVGNTGDNQNHYWRTTNFAQSYAEPVVFAAMQTTDGTDTATVRQRWLMNNMVEFKIEEEQSYDSETAHTSEDIGYIIFPPGLLD